MTEKLWLQSYDPGVPQSLHPYPEKTLVDLVRETARERPNHPALLFKGTRLSYRELDRLSDEFADALATLGVRKGDRVALLLPNSPQVVIAQLGAWKAGAIVSPINLLYTEHELEHALRESGAEIVVVLTAFYNKVKAVQSRTRVRQVVATHPAVAEVCVAGLPNEHQSEAVKAWVVRRDGAEVSPEEIRTHCRATLAGYKVPKHIEFRETLPKSTVGKVLRRELVKS